MHPAEPEQVLNRLAERQHGRVARWQLVRLEFDDEAIRHRLNEGSMRTERRGVYVVGPVSATFRGRLMRDVLACGPGAVLGGESVLQLAAVRPQNRRRTVVLTPRRGRRAKPGIDLRTTRSLPPEQVIEWDGIPATTLGRALADAAPALDDEQLEAAYERAIVDHELDVETIPRPNRRLNELIACHAFGTALTESELENLFRGIIKRVGFPQPLSNPPVWTGDRHYRPDFVWPDQKVIAEIDGWRIHRAQSEADRRREAHLAALGFTIQRFSKIQLLRRHGEIERALRPFL